MFTAGRFIVLVLALEEEAAAGGRVAAAALGAEASRFARIAAICVSKGTFVVFVFVEDITGRCG
jgi:hypothetical protein